MNKSKNGSFFLEHPLKKCYNVIDLASADNIFARVGHGLNVRDELAFGNAQIINELSRDQVPHEKREGLLHFVTAHHHLAVSTHVQALQVAILAHFEQEHVIAGDLGSRGHHLTVLLHFVMQRQLDDAHGEAITRQSHHMLAVVDLKERKVGIHGAVQVGEMRALVQVDNV